jgi:hypothetical protein
MSLILNGTSGITFNDSSVQSAAAVGAKAWVNFNGTGTVAIRASFNVSTITDNGTGDYTVNFTTAMPDVNYGWTASGGDETNSNRITLNAGTNYSAATGSLRVRGTASASYADLSVANIAVFR